jgi:hypothetical protein
LTFIEFCLKLISNMDKLAELAKLLQTALQLENAAWERIRQILIEEEQHVIELEILRG